MLSFDFMVTPENALESVLQKMFAGKEEKDKYITGGVAVENLSPDHVYRWLVDFMNQELSDIGVNSTGGRLLPPIHCGLVQVRNDIKTAHVLEADGLAFIVVTQPMVEEMLRLSHSLVQRNQVFMRQQIAPAANSQEIAQLILFMQFCLVTVHEYSHLVRGHLDDLKPLQVGGSLSQAQELDADGYGIYHDLAYFFQGRGRLLTSQWLRISNGKALENSILDCYLLSMMLQFCARWAGKAQVAWDGGAEHPPQPLRIECSILFVEMVQGSGQNIYVMDDR